MNRTRISPLSPRERARLAATLRQAQTEGARTQRNTEIVALGAGGAPEEGSGATDQLFSCGCLRLGAAPHPDRDTELVEGCCPKCANPELPDAPAADWEKELYLQEFRDELDAALLAAWLRNPRLMALGGPMIGVYSERAARLCGTCFYLSQGGVPVEVTAVYPSIESALNNYRWPDAALVGWVQGWHRKGRWGTAVPLVRGLLL